MRERSHIVGDTGLFSKRAELYDASFMGLPLFALSRCPSMDLEGHRFVDFVGSVGAILLSYAAPDETHAVRQLWVPPT